MATLYETLTERIARREPTAMATVTEAPDGHGPGQKLLIAADGATEGAFDLPIRDEVARDALDLLSQEKSLSRSYPLPGGGAATVFIHSFPPPPQLIIFGAVHVAIPLHQFAKALGFRVVVSDARYLFANAERFPEADEILLGYPDEVAPKLRIDPSTYIVILTHDTKFDEPALEVSLSSPARYIGAIGSRQTNKDRRARLLRRGIPEQDVNRIYGPVGLDIGAGTPEETALAILAEIVAVKNKRSGGSLRTTSSAIHTTAEVAEART